MTTLADALSLGPAMTVIFQTAALWHDVGKAHDESRWEGAIEELERLGFIVSRDPKREVFSVTQEGYVYAESFGITPET